MHELNHSDALVAEPSGRYTAHPSERIYSQTKAAEQSTSKKTRSLHIPSLDGIRAISFLLVFVSHAGLGKLIPGGFGVTIFFFLSGYLITTLLRIEYDHTNHISLKQFYLRRALRIFPPFYLVLGAAVALTLAGVLQGALLPSALLAQVFYVNNIFTVLFGFDGQAPGTGIYWSLAIEEHFYLVFPAIYLLLRRYLPSRLHQIYVLISICAGVLLWRYFLVYGLHSPENRTYLATDTRIDSILFGCILAIYGNPVLDRTGVTERRWLWLWLPLGMVCLLVSLLYRDPAFRESSRYTLQGIGLFPIFITAIRYHDRLVFRWLNLSWVKFMGALSYSLYLVHFVILSGLAQVPDLPLIAQGVLALGLSIAIATAMYYIVERPCAHLRKRLSEASA